MIYNRVLVESSSEEEPQGQHQVDSREAMQCRCPALSAPLSLPVSNRPDYRTSSSSPEQDPRAHHDSSAEQVRCEEEVSASLRYVSTRCVDPAFSGALRLKLIDDSCAGGRRSAQPADVRRGPSPDSVRRDGLGASDFMQRQIPTTSFRHEARAQGVPSSPLPRARDATTMSSPRHLTMPRLPSLPSPSALIRIRILESHLRFTRGAHSERGVTIIEKINMLRYKSNPFEWNVRLQMESLDARSNWCIEFVQNCVAMHCENVYGSSWWEFHELSHGRRSFLNDSTGRLRSQTAN